MKKVQILVVMLVVGLVALAGCAPRATPTPSPKATPTPQATSDWDRVLAAAKREGSVTVYMGLGSDAQTAIYEGFMKAHGIKTDIIGVEAGDVREKVRMEQQIGTPIGDLVVHGITEPSWLKNSGFTQPPSIKLPEAQKTGIWRVHPSKYDPTGMTWVLYQDVSPEVLINTSMIKPQDEPKSWYDLLDPKWKDKIIMRDPRRPGPGAMGIYAAMELGEDYWKKLAQQNVVLESKADLVTSRVVLGEKPIAVFHSTTRSEQAIAAGAPGKMLHLKEGSHISTKGAALIKNPPHPNAAMVLLNWLLTPEGQTALGKSLGRDTLRTDVKADWIKIDAFKPGSAYNLFTRESVSDETQAEAIAFAKRIFGK